MAIAEEMGGALQHSASSINIRERLDFSCAIFDGAGRLVANAPHMPVHLGSMGESVRTILRQRTKDTRGIRRGDAYALNAPYDRSEEHTSELQSLMRISYAVFCLKKKKQQRDVSKTDKQTQDLQIKHR